MNNIDTLDRANVDEPDGAMLKYIFARGAERDQLRPLAFVDAWGNIGKDFAIDYIMWCATGESFRGADHGPISASTRKEARAYLRKAGLHMPDEDDGTCSCAACVNELAR